MSGRRAAFGVALKTARRNKKRTFYLVALIAIPVMVAVSTSAFVRAGYVSPEEQAGSDFGSATVRIEDWGLGPEVRQWIETTSREIDSSARVSSIRQTYSSFNGKGFGPVLDLDFNDPLGHGILGLTAGSAPTGAGEIVLTEHLADQLGVGVGDHLALALRDKTPTDYEVVGLASHPILWNTDQAVVAPSEMDLIDANRQAGGLTLISVPNDSAFAAELNQRWDAERYAFYPAGPEWPMPGDLYFIPEDYYAEMTADELAETRRILDAEGEISASNYVYALFPNGVFGGDLPQFYAESLTDRLTWNTTGLVQRAPVVGTAVAAIILAEVAFIAGAAFATGTRRRLREIGLLGANGASVEHIRTSVVAEGLIAGLIGGLLGSAAALLLMIAGRPVLQQFVDRRIDEFPLSALDMAGPIAVGVISCVVAAWLPAKTASSVPTLTALQGRMPVAAPKRWIVPVGLLTVGLGVPLLIVGLAGASDVASAVSGFGAALMIAGTALLAGPMVAWVSKHAERFPVTSRIVLRDSGRQRSRAAAAVAATMVIMMAPVAALAAVGSTQASNAIYGLEPTRSQLLVDGEYDEEYNLLPLTGEDIEAVRRLLPDARFAEFDVLDTRVEYPAELAARTRGFDESQGGYYISPTRTAVATDDLLAFLDDPAVDEALQRDGRVLLGVDRRETTITVDGVETQVAEVPLAVNRYSFPRLLVTPTVAAGMTGETRPFAVFEVESSTWDDIWGNTFADVWQADLGLSMSGSGTDLPVGAVMVVAFLVTMLIVLIVVAVITSLSAAEADNDLRTVVAVGATNSIRRRYLGLQSGLHTLMGALLAVPLTLLLYKVVVVASGRYQSVGSFGTWDSGALYVPWLGIAVLLVGLPLVIALITAGTVRSAPTTPPRRAT